MQFSIILSSSLVWKPSWKGSQTHLPSWLEWPLIRLSTQIIMNAELIRLDNFLQKFLNSFLAWKHPCRDPKCSAGRPKRWRASYKCISHVYCLGYSVEPLKSCLYMKSLIFINSERFFFHFERPYDTRDGLYWSRYCWHVRHLPLPP